MIIEFYYLFCFLTDTDDTVVIINVSDNSVLQ